MLEAATASWHATNVMARLDELATISSDKGAITRLHLTPEHASANETVARWMTGAGMTTRVDEAGNLIGRYEGDRPGAPALVLGSHLDTVRDAGRYDGTLGVIVGIAVVSLLAERGQRLPFPIEVIGFADEEGVRFNAGLIGSKAVVGTFDPRSLELRDEGGVTLAAALRDFGLDPDQLARAAKDPRDVLAYLEVHIEQGPVLELEAAPLGVVTAIAGAVRHRVSVRGESGHAGTVPMAARRDALTAAAECALALEAICREANGAASGSGPAEGGGVVGTVGELVVPNGAVNVVPGRVEFSVDIRAADDGTRRAVDDRFRVASAAICAERGVTFAMENVYEAPACGFDGPLQQTLTESIIAEGLPLRQLPSGAGHDAMALADFTDAAMLFVRCRGGVSHHPSEAIQVDDVELALMVTFRTVVAFAAGKASY